MSRSASIALGALAGLHMLWIGFAALQPQHPAEQFREHLDLPAQWSSVAVRGTGLTVGVHRNGAWEDVPLRFACSSEHGVGVALFCVDSPDRFFPLGTDALGRCRLSRLVMGGVISLLVALGAVLVALALGFAVGLLGAFSGQRLDALLTLGVDVGRALPWLLLVLALRAHRPLDMSPRESVFVLAMILGWSGWFSTSRLVRIRTRQLLEEPWVEAARGLGLSRVWIGWRHLRPHLGPLLTAQALTLVPAFIVAETSISFLGLGVVDPGVSWGSLLGELRHRDVILGESGALFVLCPLLLLNLAYLWTAKIHRFE